MRRGLLLQCRAVGSKESGWLSELGIQIHVGSLVPSAPFKLIDDLPIKWQHALPNNPMEIMTSQVVETIFHL